MGQRRSPVEIGYRAAKEVWRLFSSYGIARKMIGCGEHTVREWERGVAPSAMAAPVKKASAMKKLTYKGYTVVQSSRNHHVMIGKDGKMVHHAACDHPMTDKELRQMVDDYLTLTERLGAKR